MGIENTCILLLALITLTSLVTIMKRFLLCLSLASVASFALAQNKTLGVGVTTPNANAALHVESPTNNQGMIIPRLSTAQRTAMSAILGANDEGMLLYDTDLNTVYVWSGSSWNTTAQAAGAKLTYPYVDTVNSAPANSNLMRIIYNGTGATNVGVAHFENLNPQSGFSSLFSRTNSATNGAADFVVNNVANNNDAVGATTNGVGRAGSFSIFNPASQSYALFATTNGDSLGAAVYGHNTGNGFGVFGRSSGTKFASAAVIGEHDGTGDAAGVFRINNASNNYSALYGETNGGGPALMSDQKGTGTGASIYNNGTGPNTHGIYVQTNANTGGQTIFAAQLGTGRAGQFQITNTANTNSAIRAFTSGLGNAGYFTVNNAANTFPAILTQTNGTGAALVAENTGTANAIAAIFKTTNAANTYPAIQASTAGIGPGVRVIQEPTAVGGGMDVFIQNPANNSMGFNVYHQGTGGAGAFIIANGSSGSTAVYGETNGTGGAGSFKIANASSNNTALYSETNGTGNAIVGRSIGTARSAFFEYNNASGSTPGVTVVHNGNGGNGFESLHSGTGDAIFAQAANGSAGNFQVTNGTNPASAAFAMTNSPTGFGMGMMNTAGGNAFGIFQGGMKISTHTQSTASITTRAAAYLLQNGTGPSYSFGFTLSEGEIFYIFNDDATNSVSVNGLNLNSQSGGTFIYLGGALRRVN